MRGDRTHTLAFPLSLRASMNVTNSHNYKRFAGRKCVYITYIDYLSYIQEVLAFLAFLAAFKVLMTLSSEDGGFVDTLFSSRSFTTRAESPSPALRVLSLISSIKVFLIE